MEMPEREKLGLYEQVEKLLTIQEQHSRDIEMLRGVDEEKKAYSNLLRSTVIEVCDVVIGFFDQAVEEKQRKKVDKLKELLNPLR